MGPRRFPDLPAPDDVRMKGFRGRAEVEAVQRMVDQVSTPLATEIVPVMDCAGRVLTEEVDAPVDIPGFDRAAMDGFALKGEETFGAATDNPLPFTLVGEARAGRGWDGRLTGGQAVRIMTGAPLPDGADAVIPAEQAALQDRTVQVIEAIPPGKHVSRRGEDVRSGSRVFSGGRCLRPQDAGLLASLGISPVHVIRRPTVSLIATGDELLPAGEKPRGAAIIDSNSVVLTALVTRDGGVPLPVQRIRDGADVTQAALQEAAGDVILVSGGSSVGLEDHAPGVVARMGSLEVHGIAMRPSSPTGIGLLPARQAGGRERPVFLLPGNPVSNLCAYDFFAGRAIRRLGGLPAAWPYPRQSLPLARKVVSVPGRVDYLRVGIRDGKVEPLAVAGAAVASSTVRAHGFVVIPRDAEGFAAGEEVDVFLYDRVGVILTGREAGETAG
ncbi:MAG: molybdopterin molybdotransferase MoeA [Acidobacteria bacterium]|nr:molybdopterin molybdotransferase MoeA [Acidobacteriota bacterium]